MAGNRYVNLGSASAQISIDTSAAQKAIPEMQQIAQQITQIVNQINQQIASVQNQGVSRNDIRKIVQEAIDLSKQQQAVQQQVTQAVKETTQAQQQATQVVQQQTQAVQAQQVAQTALQQLAQQRIGAENQVLGIIRSQIEAMNAARSIAQTRNPLLGAGGITGGVGVPQLPSGLSNMAQEISSALALTEQTGNAEESINTALARRVEFQQQITASLQTQIELAQQFASEITQAVQEQQAQQARQARPGEVTVSRDSNGLPSGINQLGAGSPPSSVIYGNAPPPTPALNAGAMVGYPPSSTTQQQMAAQAAAATAQAAQQVAVAQQAATQATAQQAQAQAQVTQQVIAQQAAQKQNVAAAQDQFAITRAMVNELKTQVAQQQNLYQTAAARAPSGMDRSGVEAQLRSARQPIVDIQADLAKLRTAYLQATTPQQQAGIDQQLIQLQQRAQQAQQGVQALATTVDNFGKNVAASRSGVEGYFNSVRENLEKINETSLAANLQEISFRLLPLGVAAAALTQRGVAMAQTLQETALSFNALTGSQEKTDVLMKQLTDQAGKLGLPLTTVLTVFQRFAPAIRQAGGDFSQIIDLASRLLTLNPGAGFETAIMAITKGLGGTDRSLLTQFNVIPADLKAAEKAAGSFAGGLNVLLNQMGRTTGLAEKFGETNRSAVTRMQDSIDKFLATSMNHFLDGMTGASDTVTNFFNNLASGSTVFTTLTGGIITLVSTLSGGLIALGQFALAFNAIKALAITPQTTAFVAGLVEKIGLSFTFGLPIFIQDAFLAAAGAISTIVGAAVKIGVALGLAGIAAAIGAAIGVGLASLFGAGGTHDPAEQLNRLIESISVGIGALVAAIEIVIATFHNAGDLFSAAFNNIRLIIGAAGDTLKDIFSHIGAVLLNAVGAIEQTLGSALQSIAQFLTSIPGVEAGGVGLAGVNLSGQGKIDQFNAGQILQKPLQDFFGNIAGQLVDLSKFKLLTDDQLTKIQNDASHAVLGVFNFLSGLLQPGKVVATPSTGTGVPPAFGAPGSKIDQQSLDDALKVINQISQAENSYAIQVSRTQQDRAISAQRDAEDRALAQSRAAEDFARQQGRAEDDYYRSRQESIDDFNRQTIQAQDQVNQQRQKQQADYNTQTLRAEQDHLVAMQRMARDITDAISARDFLSAQKTIEKMQDAETDFQTEQTRRKEDFAKQMADLVSNLKDQQSQRAADFALQLKRQQDAFNLQRQRQVDDNNRQLQLQVQDNARRLQRQAQDYALQDQRRQEDFVRQINDMVQHNDILKGIWNNGLEGLRQLTSTWFQTQLQALAGVANSSAVAAANPDSVGSAAGSEHGSRGNTVSVGTTDLGTGTPFVNQGTAFGLGSWFVPQTMKATVHQGEIIIPPGISQRIRAGEASIGANGQNSPTVNVPMTVINGADLDEDQLIEKAGTVLIPRISQALERRAKTTQPRRGWN